MKKPLSLGPAILVTAAFIGPGTVMTASQAGAQFGYAILWAVGFSVVTAIALQAMAARLGVATGKGLAAALQTSLPNPVLKYVAIALVLSAIFVGNSAYQTGNLLGAAEGLRILTSVSSTIWTIAIALVAVVIVWVGRFSVLQMALTILVASMGVIFVVSAFLCGPNLVDVAVGLKPSIPVGSEWTIIALIGTTVVPYNLFLHASAAAAKYKSFENKSSAIRHSLLDTVISITIGGLITAALLITAAVTFGGTDESLSYEKIANQLKPAMGAWAQYGFAIGLFAAGLTSSITAPIAAAMATAGCFGWQSELSNIRIKIVSTIVIAIGVTLAIFFGRTPTQTIIFAQVANGLLLPIVVMFLMYILNREQQLGEHRNSWLANGFGVVVLFVTLLISSRQFHKVWNTIQTLLESNQ